MIPEAETLERKRQRVQTATMNMDPFTKGITRLRYDLAEFAVSLPGIRGRLELAPGATAEEMPAPFNPLTGFGPGMGRPGQVFGFPLRPVQPAADVLAPPESLPGPSAFPSGGAGGGGLAETFVADQFGQLVEETRRQTRAFEEANRKRSAAGAGVTTVHSE
jgi:hypothetical protein